MTRTRTTDGELARFASGSAVVFGGIVVGSALALAAETYIARSLDPETYGSVAVAYTVALSVGTLLSMGLRDATTRLLSGGDDRTETLRAALALALVLGVVAAAVLFASRGALAALFDDPAVAATLPPLLLFVLAFPLGQVALGAFRADGDARLVVAVKDGFPRVLGGIVLLAAVAAGLGATAAVAYWLVFPVVLAVLGVGLLLRRDASLVGVPAHGDVARVWRFAWPLAAGGSMFLLLSNLDVLMIGYYLSAADVGHYRAVQPLRQVTTFVLTAVSFTFLPLATRYYADGRHEELLGAFRTSTKWVVALTLPVVLVCAAYSPAVVALLFGPAYAPAAPVLTVLTLGLFVRAVAGLNGEMVKALDRPRVELLAAAAGVAVNVVVNTALIPRLGIVGAAAGTALGYAAYNAVEVAVVYRAVGVHPFGGALLRPLALTAAVAVLTRVAVGPDVSAVGLCALGAWFAAVHLASMALAGGLDDTDRLLFARLARRAGLPAARLLERVTAR